MPHRVNLGLVTLTTDEWVVRGNTTVVTNSQNFTAVILRILRFITTVGHEDRAVASKRDPRRAKPRFRYKDVADLCESLAIPTSARKRVGRPRAFERLRVGEIDQVVFGKMRMQRDIHQTVDSAGIARLARV